MTRQAIFFLLFPTLFLIQCDTVSKHQSLSSGDWPQYRADYGRTGYTPSEIPRNLSLKWKIEQPAPSPAWQGIDTRMIFDYAYEPVISGKTLFYGSSTDCKVYAVDAVSGKERWTFYTDAPIRFAPAVWKDQIYVVSDDGYLYCLSANDGKAIWKKRVCPDDSMVLGNERMVSRWPVRGGVVIKDDILYFGAGIWPSEGIYIYAIDPEDGSVLWVNDDSGGLEMDQPHAPARSKSGISAQGYLAIGGNHLFVTTGRAVPAALDLTTGKLDYFHLRKYAGGWQKNSYGGSRVMATDSHVFVTSGNIHDRKYIIGARNALFRNETGYLETRDEFNSRALAVSPDYVLYIDSKDGELKAIKRDNLLIEREVGNSNDDMERQAFLNTDLDFSVPIESEIKDSRGNIIRKKSINTPAWTIQTGKSDAISIIVAGNTIIAGMLNNYVKIMDMESKSVVWSTEVDGIPYGLAAAHGRLYVSTGKGSIYCFDGSGTKRPKVIQKAPFNSPYGNNKMYADAAEEIIYKSGINEGYCLDIGCGNGALSYELAKRTNLHIIAIDSDPKMVARARKRLDDACLYGSRVTVHLCDLYENRYPSYFANLIVSGRSVTDEKTIQDKTAVSHIQRPFGGKACFGKPGSIQISVRGELEGSGQWTHQYHDPANTVTSEDDLVKGDLRILWFRDPDFIMPSRHGRGVSPLFSNGRLFVQGLNGIRAYDAYNGHILWEHYIEDIQKVNDQDTHLGVNLTQGNWCVDNDRLYVRVEDSEGSPYDRYCLVLDTTTGNLLEKYSLPSMPGSNTWGYIAVTDGTIFGSIVNDEHELFFGKKQHLHIDTSKMYDESIVLFAMDAKTGKAKWMYKADHSIHHNSIAIGNNRVYLIDRPVPDMGITLRRPSGDKHTKLPAGTLVALDAETGKVVYKINTDIFGNLLALSNKHDILIMTYYEAHSLLSLGLSPEYTGRMSAFRASDGAVLWEVKTGLDNSPKARPIINDRTIFIEPYSWDILTGDKHDFKFERSYGCGMLAGSKHMMVYRSGTLGYFKLDAPDDGTLNYGGIRPGCWINAIPAGGLVLMPDATDRCNCSYLNKATIALIPVKM